MKKAKTFGMLLLFGIALSGVYLENGYAQTWVAAGSRSQDYEMGGNPTVSHGSENAGFIKSKVSQIDGYGTWMTSIAPDNYLGKAIKMTAYLKTTNVDYNVGMWMRVDAAGNQVLNSDKMQNRPIRGTTDWQEYEIVFDIPEKAIRIHYGFLLHGTGQAWMDGLKLTTVERSWVDQNTGTSEYVRAIKAVNENTVWAGAEKGIYLRTTDGGANWTSAVVPGAESVDFHSIAAIDQNTAYYLANNFNGGDGRIYKTTDSGTTWTLQYSRQSDPGVFFASIAFWDKNNGIAVSDPVNGSFLIITTTDGGESWNQVPAANIPAPLSGEFAGFPGTSLVVEGTNNVWFGTSYIAANTSPVRILRSTDQGLHWTAVNTPLSTAGKMHGIWTIAFKDSLNGFAGSWNQVTGVANTLAKTTDGGSNWTLVSPFLPINVLTLVYVPYTNNSVIFVTSVEGSAYSDDGGTTWKYINGTNLVGMSFASPTAGWALPSLALPSAPGRIVRFAGQLPTEVLARQQEYTPTGFELMQNYPNPFNPRTTISFSIPQAGFVGLKIYDMLGREIQTLVNDFRQAGSYSYDFDASRLSNGIYFYQLKVGDRFSETKKMLYLK